MARSSGKAPIVFALAGIPLIGLSLGLYEVLSLGEGQIPAPAVGAAAPAWGDSPEVTVADVHLEDVRTSEPAKPAQATHKTPRREEYSPALAREVLEHLRRAKGKLKPGSEEALALERAAELVTSKTAAVGEPLTDADRENPKALARAFPSPQARQALQALLDHPDAGIRGQAAAALARWADVGPALLARLDLEEDWAVQRTIFGALAQHGDAGDLVQLEPWARSEKLNPRNRDSVIKAIRAIATRTGQPLPAGLPKSRSERRAEQRLARGPKAQAPFDRVGRNIRRSRR
jgi:hypothetical protein